MRTNRVVPLTHHEAPQDAALNLQLCLCSCIRWWRQTKLIVGC